MNPFLHERLYRSEALMERLKTVRLTICGAGAIGGNLAENLARTGLASLRLIDQDRIEAHNLSTQPFLRQEIGQFKAKSLANHLYRSVFCEVDAQPKRLTATSVNKLLADSELVVDAFDNSESRQLIQDWARDTGVPTLHVGMAAGYGEAIWDGAYQVPSDLGAEVCDYPLARNLVQLTVMMASEVLLRYLDTGVLQAYTCTLGDLKIHPFK